MRWVPSRYGKCVDQLRHTLEVPIPCVSQPAGSIYVYWVVTAVFNELKSGNSSLQCKKDLKQGLNIELLNDRTVVPLTYADCTCTERYLLSAQIATFLIWHTFFIGRADVTYLAGDDFTTPMQRCTLLGNEFLV